MLPWRNYIKPAYREVFLSVATVSSSSSAVAQPRLDPQSTCCQELGGAAQVFRRSPQLVDGWLILRPYLLSLFPPDGTVLVDVVDRLFRFFAIAECRVHDASSLQVHSQATVCCSQLEYSGLLMSCQTIDWVSRGVVGSSGSSPLTFIHNSINVALACNVCFYVVLACNTCFYEISNGRKSDTKLVQELVPMTAVTM